MRIQSAMNWLASVTICAAYVLNSASCIAQDESNRDAGKLGAIEKYWMALKNNNATVFNHATVSNMKCNICHQGNFTWAPQQLRGESNLVWLSDAIQQNGDLHQYVIQNLSTSANPLGVQVVSLSPEFAGHLGVEQAAVVLRDVPENSPAYQAGLRRYDVILQANGEKLDSPAKFDEVVTAQAGRTLALHLLHRGEKKQLTLSVPGIVSTATPARSEAEQLKEVEAETSAYKLGVVLAPVDDVLRSHLNLPRGEGVLITEVTNDGSASKIGCEANDIFLSLDDKPITSQEHLKSLVQQIGDREVALKLLRRGKSIEVKIKPKLVKEVASTDLGRQRDDLIARYKAIDNQLLRRLTLDYSTAAQVSHSEPNQNDSDSSNAIQKVKTSVTEIQAKIADMMVALEALEKEAAASKSNKP